MRSAGGRLREGEGHTGKNALPDIYPATFGIPSAALRRKGPVDVDVPDCGRVLDDGSGHCCGAHEVRRWG